MLYDERSIKILCYVYMTYNNSLTTIYRYSLFHVSDGKFILLFSKPSL